MIEHNRITPENITVLRDNEIFTFGSNTKGQHGKGAALLAMRKFGAKPGQGTGLMGKSYGIATKDYRMRTLTLSQIYPQIQKFLKFAKEHPELHFLCTKVGCGLAGYKAKEIAPLFFMGEPIPDNVSLPLEFWRYKPNA